MNLALGIIGAGATLLAAIAAVGAWVAARQSTAVAKSLAAIERRRWHNELLPQLKVICTYTALGDGMTVAAALRVRLVGPPGLDRLDEVTVTIRDDTDDHTSDLAGGPSAEEVARQVWGPYRFVAGVDGADAAGRGVAPVKLLLGDDRKFRLEPTPAPPWNSDDGGRWWQDRYLGLPVRLALHCRHDDHEPWTVHVEVFPELVRLPT